MARTETVYSNAKMLPMTDNDIKKFCICVLT